MKVPAKWHIKKRANPSSDISQLYNTHWVREGGKSACWGKFKVTGKHDFLKQGCELCKS